MSHTHGTVVAAYLRRSSAGTTKQEASIADQRAEIQRYCDARGWVIATWYVDDGKSGSIDTHKRVEFQKMLDAIGDAERLWTGIVIWNSSRWGRTGGLDQQAAKTCVEAGVWLECVQGGRVDWTSFAGELAWLVAAMGDKKYSTDLSANSVRGRRSAIERGQWAAGKVPWGYDRKYIREGAEPIILPRKAKAGRPAGYHLFLIVNDAEVKLVRWVFDTFCSGRSLRSIAGELNAKGIDTPHGTDNNWLATTVGSVLRQVAYVGTISSSSNRKSRTGKFNKVDKVIHNATPVIIDREIFDTAQRMLATIKDRRQLHSGPKHQSGLLSGILKCGHCGHCLKKQVRQVRRCQSCNGPVPRVTLDGKCLSCGKAIGKKFVPAVLYYCASSMYYPESSSCRSHVVYEAAVLPKIRTDLLNRIESEVLHTILGKAPEAPNPDLDRVRAKRDELSRDIAKCTRRLATCDDEIADDLTRLITAWRDELKGVEAQINLAEATTDPAKRKAVQGWLDDVRGEWVKFDPFITGSFGDPVPVADGVPDQTVPAFIDFHPELMARRDSLSALLRQLAVSVAVHWKPTGRGLTETPDFARISATFDVPVTCDVPVLSGRRVW